MGTKPLIVIHVKIIETIVKEIDVQNVAKYIYFIFDMFQGFQGQNPKYRLGNVKRVG